MKQKNLSLTGLHRQRGSITMWASLALVCIIAVLVIVFMMPEKVQYLQEKISPSEPEQQEVVPTNADQMDPETAMQPTADDLQPEASNTNVEAEPAMAESNDTATLNDAEAEKKDLTSTEISARSSVISSSTRTALVEGGGLALILDDAGYGTGPVETAINFSIPLTISVLPDAPDAVRVANLAHNAGKTVMLHMPMEPKDPNIADKMMSKTGLTAGMTESEVRHMVEKTFTRIPHIAGMSNHMGSMLTEQADTMRWLMKINRENGMFFLDSLTTSHSIARAQAADAGIAWASRRFFLDNDRSPEGLSKMWKKILKRAAKKGGCIVIFHPHRETLAFLKQHVHEADGLLVPLEALLHPARG